MRAATLVLLLLLGLQAQAAWGAAPRTVIPTGGVKGDALPPCKSCPQILDCAAKFCGPNEGCVVDPCVSCRPTCVKLARAGPSSTETMAERKAERKRKQAGKKKEKKAKEEAAEGDCPSQVYCLRDPCGLIDGVGPCGKGETCLSDYCHGSCAAICVKG